VAGALLAARCAAAPSVASAQEVQVPIDRDGKLEVITAQLERKLRLFSDYAGFVEARLFQAPDSSFVLEITQRVEGRLARVRLPLTPSAAQDLRRRVSAALAEAPAERVLDQSGRTKLLGWSAALSLLFYGPAVPIMFEVDDSRGFVGLYLLSAGAGIIAPFLATQRIPVTEGGAALATYGATRGIIHARVAVDLLASDASDAAYAAAGFWGSLGEALAGFAVANDRMSGGTAELVGIGSDVGLGFGLGTAHLGGLLDDEPDLDGEPYLGRQTHPGAAALAFLSTASGAGVGYALSRTEPYTRGDAFILRNAGLLGVHLGLAVADLSNPRGDQQKRYTALALTGGFAGLIAGHRLVHGREFTTAQGIFTTLGQIGGGLVGLGLGYLVSPRSGDISGLLWAASAAGAGLGYGLTYQFARQAQVGLGGGRLQVGLDPSGLALAGRRAPLLALRYQF
jgi:hypothetical protein